VIQINFDELLVYLGTKSLVQQRCMGMQEVLRVVGIRIISQ
jgi:hypothetical protein